MAQRPPSPVAESATPPPLAIGTDQSSPWWWDGSAWVRALTPDRLWRWDGVGWQLTVDLPASDPAACAANLDSRAEELYAEAGEILTWRWSEWSFPESLRERITTAHGALSGAAALEARLAEVSSRPATGGLTSLLSRLSGTDDERQALEMERDGAREQATRLCADVGRQAPRPSLKEADDVLEAAINLRGRARQLSSATASLVAARAEHEERVSAARDAVATAERARAASIAAADQRVDQARERHRRRIARALDALHLGTRPGAGERLQSFGGCHLHRHVVVTPDGRGPVAGAFAALGTPGDLWKAHEGVLRSLLAIESVGAAALDDARTVATPELFLLVTTPLAASVVACRGRDEAAAARFAEALNRASAAALEQRASDEETAREARASLEAVQSDTAEVDAARAERERAGSDPQLSGAIQAARERLSEVTADTATVDAAARQVDDIIRSISAPPATLGSNRPG